MRRSLHYVVAFVIFGGLFSVGLVFSPFRENTLAGLSTVLLAGAWFLDRLVVRYARRKRAGIEIEKTPLGSVVTLYNNPWVLGWTRIRIFMILLFALQIGAMAAVTIFCGEVVHRLIW